MELVREYIRDKSFVLNGCYVQRGETVGVVYFDLSPHGIKQRVFRGKLVEFDEEDIWLEGKDTARRIPIRLLVSVSKVMTCGTSQ
ncbi:hypothetical protein [Alicyclobacillus shizuokensis]|uniref:hypothetical protein n=1 Tax=Alicyclobacillus shizuokensis TaxID=392014 RepID=UPI00082A50DE|nr:hypothetical protein [Alicyclobacillus shizuokensis]